MSLSVGHIHVSSYTKLFTYTKTLVVVSVLSCRGWVISRDTGKRQSERGDRSPRPFVTRVRQGYHNGKILIMYLPFISYNGKQTEEIESNLSNKYDNTQSHQTRKNSGSHNVSHMCDVT